MEKGFEVKGYWEELLSGTPGELMPEFDSLEEKSGQESCTAEYQPDETAVAALLEKIGCTEEALVTAAGGYLLSVYTGQKEGVVHTTLPDGTVIPFVVNTAEEETVAGYLTKAAEQLRESEKNGVYDGLEADAGLKNQVLVACCSEDGVSGQVRMQDEGDQPLLRMEILKKADGGRSLKITYRTDQYTEAYIRSLAGAYLMVLRELPVKAELKDISLISQEEEALLDSFNRTRMPVEDTDIVTLFRRMAAKYPDHEAVIYLDKRITYAELDEITERLAATIRSHGLGREDVVSVLIPRCEYMVIASLGVLKAGCAYQPLDAGYPEDRLLYMMQDAEVRLLITDHTLRDKVADYQGEVLFIEDIPSLPKAEPIADGPSPQDLFIMLYTSGTTGKPKGVMLEHRNLVDFVTWAKDYYEFTENSKAAAYASYGFDANMVDLYPALTSGAAVCIISEEMRLSLPEIRDYFIKEGITHAIMTTQVGRQFAGMYNGESLQYLTAGGEKLVPLDPPKNFTFVNAYGPTECTVCITAKHVDRMYRRVPIGKALANVKLYVVGDRGQRMPVGAPGELCAAGNSVGRGYRNLPDKTAAVFTPNPFSEEAGYDRMYHTGDIVRILPNGEIDILGRADGQVKIRGFRIELSEVEAAVRSFPGIKDATVQAFDYANGSGKYIAAYVVSDTAVDVQTLNEHIKKTKPDYMVPAVTIQLEEIPLTRNQKVDKRALPRPEAAEHNYRKPENAEEQKLYDLVVSVIGHQAFGTDTDLFEAGLSSIGLMQLMVALGDEYQVPLRIKDIRERATVLQLNAYIKGLLEKKAAEGASAAGTDTDYPLTKTQEGILIECISNPDTTIYNNPVIIRLGKNTDPERLEETLRLVVDNHPYLKMTVHRDDAGDFHARRNDALPAVIGHVRHKDPDAAARQLTEPFTLLDAPLYRFCIIEADQLYLFADVHHIILDGTSIQILLHDLCDAYDGRPLQKEVLNGYDLALEEQERRKTVELTAAKMYWEDLIADVDTDQMPLPDRQEEKPARGMRKHRSDIDVNRVQEFCAKNGLTENSFFMGAFGYLLATVNGRRDVLFTTVYNGRNDSRLMHTVDMLVKTIPVCLKTRDSERIVDYLAEVKAQYLRSMEQDLFSFAEIVHEFSVSSDVTFLWQPDFFDDLSIGGEKVSAEELEPDTAKFKLLINAAKYPDGYHIDAEYRSDLFTEDMITALTDLLEQIAEEFLKKETLAEVSLLSAEEEAKLDRFNHTEKEIPDTDIVSLFRSAADQDPEKIAVVCEDERISYGEADRISEKVGAYIRAQGLGREDAVSILIPRCASMVTLSLGALKAGCAYQPLDPGYPADRLNYMMKDAGVRLLITTKELRDRVTEYTGQVLYLEDVPSLPEAERSTEHPAPEDLFILLYTSGTTGNPKGVMLEHRNLVNFCLWYRDFYQLKPENKVAAYASYGFDANMMDLYPALTTGATVYIIPEDMRLSLLDIEAYFEKEGVTHSFMTTQVGRQFAEMYRGKSLKYLSVGGERLVPIAPPEGYQLINGYGPTECTIFSTLKPVDRLYHRVPIGGPLTNYKLYVIDHLGRRVPAGAAGELCISGRGVGRGYMNLPDKTATVFTANPFTKEPGYERMYRTGDVVRMLPNGEIDFIGRRDTQVKIRGFRIELSEVESVVRSFPGIKDATVQAFDEPGGGKYLAAYYVADETLDPMEIYNFVAARKPSYMVPPAWMQLDRIPLTRNQKVNKRELPVIERTDDYEPPKDALEKELCDLFAEILQLERVGANDDFFRLGGSSIIAAKVLMHTMTRGYDIVYKDIFDHPTPRGLANRIRGMQQGTDAGKQSQADDYDYGRIAGVLSMNNMEHIGEMSFREVGDVILTGATGFLGIHVLKACIDNSDRKIYCLMRKGEFRDVESRLTSMLAYYFGQSMKEMFGKRIFCVEGDITSTEDLAKLNDVEADVLINCAACVKHFVEDDLLDRVNYYGVLNLIDYCLAGHKRLVHASSYSVAGEMELKEGEDIRIHEDQLYFGQRVDNDYVRTKFLAERAVLEAKAERGLDGCVVRMGNLMNRHSDGEFQINYLTNSFMRSLKAYKTLHQFPVSMLDQEVEFSPIDTSAAAVLRFAGADNRFSVFHAYNNHTVSQADVIYAMKDYGFDIEIVPDEVFSATLDQEVEKGNAVETVLGLVAYRNKDGQSVQQLLADNRFSVNALFRCGFKWPITDDRYLKNAIEALDTLFFFDEDQE